MPGWLNLPNALTLLRLLMVPMVVYEIAAGRYLLGGWLFGDAAFTDILDGAAARRLHVTTREGAYLDPIADKCLLSGAFLALALAHLVPWWLVAIIFGRDIWILLGTVVMMLSTPLRSFPPSIWGKLSTFIQICTVVFWMAKTIFGSRLLDEIATAILWPCVLFTVWSGLDYTWKGVLAYRKY